MSAGEVSAQPAFGGICQRKASRCVHPGTALWFEKPIWYADSPPKMYGRSLWGGSNAFMLRNTTYAQRFVHHVITLCRVFGLFSWYDQGCFQLAVLHALAANATLCTPVNEATADQCYSAHIGRFLQWGRSTHEHVYVFFSAPQATPRPAVERGFCDAWKRHVCVRGPVGTFATHYWKAGTTPSCALYNYSKYAHPDRPLSIDF